MSTKDEGLTVSPNDSKPLVSSSANFFADAQDFLKSQLPNDFEERLKDYAVNKGYNENEFRLFKSMLEESIGFYGTMVLLKHYC